MLKKKKIINPEAEYIEEGVLLDSELKEIAKEINLGIQNIENDDDRELYFKTVIKEFLNARNIELKTEYISIREVYNSAKIEFMKKYCKMPYLGDFINILERKRVSLKRKGRVELVLSLQDRQKEIREKQEEKNLQLK